MQSPIIPSNLLLTVWTGSKELAGYNQHDSHEFLISLINMLHESN